MYQFFVDIPIQKGTILHERYEVLKVIGSGSYGIVYLCKDLKSQENRVVKQLRPSKRRHRKEVELFESEIALLHSLNHKKMPRLYETFSTDGYFFYVMSFIDGVNLEDLIFYSKKTFNEQDSLLILQQLLELVDYLHTKTIYHQDLRIPNILLKNNQLFLIDFGLSKQIQNKQEDLQEMILQDFYDLGEILLYLLYTTYPSKNKKALPWTEELSLKQETVHLLKRLLQIKEPYSSVHEISIELHAALKANENEH